MNPLLEESKLPFGAIDFEKIKAEHFLPALKVAIDQAKKKYEIVKKELNPSFDSIIFKGESACDLLDHVVEIFYALHSAHCDEELSAIAQEFSQELTKFGSDISLDERIFEQVKDLYERKEELSLNLEQWEVLESTYKDFARNGALLKDSDKESLRSIDQELSTLALQFSENLRKATNEYLFVLSSEGDLKGLPLGTIEAAKIKADERGHLGKWAFTFDFPSYFPFMQNCENRELRKKLWSDYSSKCTKGEFDNRKNVLEIVKLRKKRASLLGYADHPSFVLEKRMAKETKSVLRFIEEMTSKAKGQAHRDVDKLVRLKEELTGEADLRKYDIAFYTEKLTKKELDFDDEELRPYFKLENVLSGIFEVAQKLYGLEFKERDDLPTYHEDVEVYEVQNKDGSYVGLFYGDYFPRPQKRSGAWMTTFRVGGTQFEKEQRPFVCNVCNFTMPTDSKPSLLTLNEVLTLFHEFGHALHGLLTQVKYKSIAGANVLWDFVELPSQIMENWVFEKDCLHLFAKHYESGELIPDELIGKMKKGQRFLQGVATLRQMSLSKLDMDWHTSDPQTIDDVIEFENKSLENYELYPKEEGGSLSCSFGHIFSGGYSCGYYSYKWAEVLDADAFAYFKEKGIFNQNVAESFRKNILEKGGSEDPVKMYEKFRGHSPNSDALLKRCGLDSENNI